MNTPSYGACDAKESCAPVDTRLSARFLSTSVRAGMAWGGRPALQGGSIGAHCRSLKSNERGKDAALTADLFAHALGTRADSTCIFLPDVSSGCITPRIPGASQDASFLPSYTGPTMHALSRQQDASTETTHGRHRRFQVQIGHGNAMATVAIAALSHDLPARRQSSRHVTAAASSAGRPRLPE
ncbi:MULTISPECIES: hypothetical protein [Xanthomonas]|uniref:Uncharacterized protein n=1 Tax=Xanthomonas rydalmerensis TaxID=3046274 RepID=A0ABZ0JHT0_9XANT|nr:MULTISPECIES: hypothetical protein [unclassified Xanthomonas]WOS38986.1 hypothetical protein QN243_10995 [Xanthomonas sp. DM-2023]WOS43168.1 hypothetical protein QN242_10995 [Xanthomonas sp. DM-2023]WOS47348.1 hypothetical protein QN240_10995 [Xanthomonas sp. DM-2023]WOS51529.1 hypothetical protein QN244_10995 [Xanthomonas sp. DM-2023]WOS55711.1 hypothetical protein QN245_10995 [Xanthomonas sp. DM-2023]